jgi:hypothetical protein
VKSNMMFERIFQGMISPTKLVESMMNRQENYSKVVFDCSIYNDCSKRGTLSNCDQD